MIKKLVISAMIIATSAIMQSAMTKKSGIEPVVSNKSNDTPKEKKDTSFSLPAFSNHIPTLLVKRGENDKSSSPLSIKKIKLDVKVVGNIATTTMDITFYNDLNRVLDGEFCFPLGEGQSISYFAMDVANGLQQASVVEKAKGRIVYESIVRRKIDPALLEWTAGNNFRSRVYPIPAKGTKRIVIGFEQELLLTNKSYLYYQPFFFKDKVDEFSLRTEVFRQDVKPELYGDERITLQFDKWKENWVAEKTIDDYVADKPLSFAIPLNEKTNRVFIEKADKGNSAFYLTVEPKIFSEEKKLPKMLYCYGICQVQQKNQILKIFLNVSVHIWQNHPIHPSSLSLSAMRLLKQNLSQMENKDLKTLLKKSKQSFLMVARNWVALTFQNMIAMSSFLCLMV
jgi:hypothetical protein